MDEVLESPLGPVSRVEGREQAGGVGGVSNQHASSSHQEAKIVLVTFEKGVPLKSNGGGLHYYLKKQGAVIVGCRRWRRRRLEDSAE